VDLIVYLHINSSSDVKMQDKFLGTFFREMCLIR